MPLPNRELAELEDGAGEEKKLPPGVDGDCTGLDEKLNGEDGLAPPSVLPWGLVGVLRLDPKRNGAAGAPSAPLPSTVVGPHVTIVN